MFISKKAFDNLKEFLEQARKDHAEMAEIVRKLSAQMKDEAIKRNLNQKHFKSKWVKVNCPKCDHAFDVHSMAEDK